MKRTSFNRNEDRFLFYALVHFEKLISEFHEVGINKISKNENMILLRKFKLIIYK